jgi:hypothetical protein
VKTIKTLLTSLLVLCGRLELNIAIAQTSIADSFIWPVLGAGITDPLQNTTDPRQNGWYVWNTFAHSCPECSGDTVYVYHPGEDFNLSSCPTCDANEPVYAIANGEVIRSTNLGIALGWAVIIRHKLPKKFDLRPYILNGTFLPKAQSETTDTIVSVYIHLNAPRFGSLDVSQGSPPIPISKGDLVSTIYPSTSGGSHLHFELRYWISLATSTRTAAVGNQVNGYYKSWQDLTDFGHINPSTDGVSARTFMKSQPCHSLDSSDPVPNGWGAAYNVLSPDKELLLRAFCTNSLVTADVGPATYIYNQGYALVNNQWQQTVFSCTDGALVSNAWCQNNASATLPNSSTYYIAYTCNWTGTKWNCGCRDQTCAQNLWQLQGIQR